MAVKNNAEIGRVNCQDCGANCSVHQQSSKNAFLYTRFCDCNKKGMTTRQLDLKPDEKQQYIFDNVVLHEGAEMREPPHIAKKSAVVAPLGEWKPAEELVPEKPDQQPDQQTSGGFGLSIAVGLLAVFGFGAVLAGVKR